MGPIHFYSFYILVALGAFIALYVMVRRAILDGFPKVGDAVGLWFVALVSGFLGARLLYVIQNADRYREHPLQILAIWQGGLTFYGGIVGAILALVIFMSVRKIPFWNGFDFLYPLVLTHAVSRIGCFLHGCCYGGICDLPWAVQFPKLAGPRHPAQLYEAFFLFGLFLILAVCYKRKYFAGQIVSIYTVFYGIGRLVIELFRVNNPSWLWLTWNQWMSIVIFFAGAFVYCVKSHQASHRQDIDPIQKRDSFIT